MQRLQIKFEGKAMRLLLLFCVSLFGSFSAANAMVPREVLVRTLLISATGLGTSFTLDVDGRQYLITAKHIVSGLVDDTDGKIKIFHKSGWQEVSVHVFKCAEPVDIAVLVPTTLVTATSDLPLRAQSKGVFLGQDAYFAGFPFGEAKVFSDKEEVLPVVRKVVVAQFDCTQDPNAMQFVLDGFNNHGFSGSPFVYSDLNSPQHDGGANIVAGVIVNYKPETAPVQKPVPIMAWEATQQDQENANIIHNSNGDYYRLVDTGFFVKSNSGLIGAWAIEPALELIHKHPIGPLVTPVVQPTK